MHLLLALLGMSQGRIERTFPLFTTAQGDYILSESIPMASSLAMEFNAFGRKFRLELKDSSYRPKGIVMKQSLCDFSVHAVNGVSSYGSMSFCDSIHGSFVFSEFEYQIRSVTPSEIEVEETRHDPENVQSEEVVLSEGNPNRKFIKVFLLNDFERVQEIGPDINRDTEEIFKNAKRIFERNGWNKHDIELVLSGIFNIVDKPLINDPLSEFQDLNRSRFERSSDLRDTEQIKNIEKLRVFSEMFGPIKNDVGNASSLLAKSNLVLLLQASDANRVNGLTFIGGANSPSKGFGIIKISDADSYFYKGKILAHEISHSLGAQHDPDTRYLMKAEESPAEREEDVLLSPKSVRDIEDFISENHIDFGSIDTCGNGILDGTKECDSGLPFGSSCCTKECKLRPQAQCDDRNGKCCRQCILVPKGTNCRSKSQSVHKADCEENSYCNGMSSKCEMEYVRDGLASSSGGICKKGVAQTESLICQRIGKFFSPKCSSQDGKLWCLDDYDVCAPVLTSFHDPITLPPSRYGTEDTSRREKTRSLHIFVIIPLCFAVILLLMF